MKLAFSPQRRDDTVNLEKTGNRIRINGELMNFSGLNDGDIIRAEAVPHEFIVGDVKMIDGDLHLTVILPHGPNPEPWQAFPEPIEVTEDGPIDVPVDTTVEHVERRAEGGYEIVTTTRRWHREPEEEVEFIADPEPVEHRVEVEGGCEIVTVQKRHLADPLEVSRVFFANEEPEIEEPANVDA